MNLFDPTTWPDWAHVAADYALLALVVLVALQAALDRVIIPMLAANAAKTKTDFDDRAVVVLEGFAGGLAKFLDAVQRWLPVNVSRLNPSSLASSLAARAKPKGPPPSGVIVGLALLALAGCGGPQQASTERRAMQEVVLAGGRILASVDAEVGPVCRARTSAHIEALAAGALTPDTFAEAEATCRKVTELYLASSRVLLNLESAADSYEAGRDADGFDEVAPCVVLVLVHLERAAHNATGYRKPELLQTIVAGLEGFAAGQCTIPDYLGAI